MARSSKPKPRLGTIKRQSGVRQRPDARLPLRAHPRILNPQDEHFIAGLGHELRTPIGSILGLTDALLDETYGPLNPKQSNVLQTIQSSGRHLEALVKDLLTLSAVRSPGLEITPVELRGVLEQCVTALDLEHRQRRQTIAIDCPPDLVVSTDERRLRQILFNLIDNAIKFAGDEGAIRVVGDREPREGGVDVEPTLKLTVSDSGPGIPSEDHARVFEPFGVGNGRWRSTARSSSRKGLGLGLAIVKTVTLELGGEVGFESAPGIATTFWVRLPLSYPNGQDLPEGAG